MPAPQTPLSYNHQTQFVTLPVTTATSSVRHKYFQCCGTPVHGRSCLERMIFCLMVILMVAVFLVAALLCLHIGSGGLKRLSTYMFADQGAKHLRLCYNIACKVVTHYHNISDKAFILRDRYKRFSSNALLEVFL